MININHLKFNYKIWDDDVEKEKTVLDEVTIELHEGDFIAVIGANGSGKSTLAKHLNSLLIPSEGNVEIDGLDTSDESNTRKIRDTVGMMFQNPDNQIIGSSVEEDVAFGPENRRWKPERIVDAVTRSLKRIGLYDRRKDSPNRLSGGQKQKVALAGVIAVDAKYIVLDEPTAMLDPSSREEVMESLYEMHDAGRTVVLITHHMDEVVHADKVIVMNGGHVAGQGTPREIFSDHEMLEKASLEEPQITQFAREIHDRGIDIELPVLTDEELVTKLRDWRDRKHA